MYLHSFFYLAQINPFRCDEMRHGSLPYPIVRPCKLSPAGENILPVEKTLSVQVEQTGGSLPHQGKYSFPGKSRKESGVVECKKRRRGCMIQLLWQLEVRLRTSKRRNARQVGALCVGLARAERDDRKKAHGLATVVGILRDFCGRFLSKGWSWITAPRLGWELEGHPPPTHMAWNVGVSF